MKDLITKTEQWFVDRNLHTFDGSGQIKKLQEEVDELKQAFWVHEEVRGQRWAEEYDKDVYTLDEVDAVGDITVVLIGYCMQRGLDFEQCLESAYNEIKDRKGKVINGVFVKEADLND